jgi:hypothetical protein
LVPLRGDREGPRPFLYDIRLVLVRVDVNLLRLAGLQAVHPYEQTVTPE